MMLYHGTSVSSLPSIFAHGIKPRGKDGSRNNWKHTVSSNKDAVYLSLCYALHFAMAACKPEEDAAIIEIFPDQLDEKLLQADEDAIEQFYRARGDNLPKDWNLKRRTIYYRSRIHHYRPDASLALMGTCGYRGTIPVKALGRAVKISNEVLTQLILEVFDPIICIENFRFMGEKHAQFHRWLFEPTEQVVNLFGEKMEMSREGITQYNLPTAAEVGGTT